MTKTQRTRPAPMDRLPAETSRLRALARSLVRDAAAADDVVQDALAAAAAREPGATGPGWLRAAVRSLAVDRARSERARARRERSVQTRRTAPDVAETVERAELARELYGAILALPEAMRDAVLLRYVDDLPPREIAARLGVEVPTVKKRIERGLAGLRSQLEERHGKDGRWAVALLPLAGRDLAAPAAASALVAWSTVAAVVLASGAALALWKDADPGPVEPVRAEVAAATPGAPTPIGLDAVAESPAREPEALAARTRTEPTEAADDPAPDAAFGEDGLELFTVDANGAPLTGVEFEWTGEQKGGALRRALSGSEPRPLRLRTDSDGALRTNRVAPGVSVFGSLQPVQRNLVVLDVGVDAAGRQVAVVVPAVDLAGVVVDPDTKEPIAGAGFEVAADKDALTTLELRIEATYAHGRWGKLSGRDATRTDAFGQFRLERAPSHHDFTFNVVRPGESGIATAPVPRTDNLAMVVEALRRPRTSRSARTTPRVFGRVLRDDGQPYPGVTVCIGQERVRAGADGAFELRTLRSGAPLIAAAKTGNYVVGPIPDSEAANSPEGAGPYDLVVPTEMETLMGQVVDPDGRPVRGLEVFLVDATSVGSSSMIYEKPVQRAGKGSPLRSAATDARGVFGFRHAQDRGYLVRVRHPRTQAVQTYRDVPSAGVLERLVFDLTSSAREVRGTVVDFAGTPIAGQEVSVSIQTLDGGTLGFHMSTAGPVTRTGHDGAFRLEDVPLEAAELVVWMPSGKGSSRTAAWSSPVEEVVDGLRIVVDCECEFVVRSSRPADAFNCVHWENAAGDTLGIETVSSGVIHGRTTTPRRENGTFPLALIPQSATTLVLRKGKEVVERIPVQPDPKERTVLDV